MCLLSEWISGILDLCCNDTEADPSMHGGEGHCLYSTLLIRALLVVVCSGALCLYRSLSQRSARRPSLQRVGCAEPGVQRRGIKQPVR